MGHLTLKEGGTAVLSRTVPCNLGGAQAFQLVSKNQEVTFFEDFNPPAVGVVLVRSC